MNERTGPDMDGAMVRDGEAPLAALDPGYADSSYWPRFQARVMMLAAPELARRRLTAYQPTVGDILASWSRLLVPASMVAAAAIASFLIPTEEARDLAIDEALVTDVDDEPLPAVLISEQVDEVMFLVAIEGTR